MENRPDPVRAAAGADKASRRFQGTRAQNLLIPILLGVLALILVGVVVITVVAVLGWIPG